LGREFLTFCTGQFAGRPAVRRLIEAGNAKQLEVCPLEGILYLVRCGLGRELCPNGQKCDRVFPRPLLYCASCLMRWAARQPVQTCLCCCCTEAKACPGGCSWVAPWLCSVCELRLGGGDLAGLETEA